MSIELVKKYATPTDDIFKAESRTSLVTNQDYDWTGAHSINVYKVSTVGLNDYKRNVSESDGEVDAISRFGQLYDLSATTEEMLLTKDRSFIFNVDRLDADETEGSVEAASALARELREVVVPEVDTYTYNKMATKAGTIAAALALTESNIYDAILAGTEIMDDAEVPDADRAIIVTPTTYKLLKQAAIFDNTEIGAEMKALGVIGTIDGMSVIKIPASRLPKNFGFMIAHKSATVRAVKLEDYGIHNDTPLSSGSIITGRICYDAFVLDNKKKGIYYQPIPEQE